MTASNAPSRPGSRRRQDPRLRALGWLLFSLGVAALLLGWAGQLLMWHPLPGGHGSEYLLGGLALGATGLWLTGQLD